LLVLISLPLADVDDDESDIDSGVCRIEQYVEVEVIS
jgi:hypothetical protein